MRRICEIRPGRTGAPRGLAALTARMATRAHAPKPRALAPLPARMAAALIATPLMATALMAAALMLAAPVWAADIAGSMDNTAFSGGKGQILQAEETKYPENFDLRNVNGESYVTPVKVQNPFGTCWGFGSISAAETSILSDPDLGKDLDASSFDLSEKHLAWFINQPLDDPTDPQNGEGTYFYEDGDKADKHYNTGGFTTYATQAFAGGLGPVLEQTIPYRGSRGETSRWRVATAYDPDGTPKDYAYKDVWYSEDDDWTLPEDLRFQAEYRLKESFILPPAAKVRSVNGTLTYEYDPAGIAAIKDQLYNEHRGVALSFCAESFVPGQDTKNKEFMSENWAHYTWRASRNNHTVAVVGWDDHYPRENFLEGHQPPGDGAFLIKNSWGSECSDFPNNGYRHWGLLQGLDKIPYDKEAKPESDRATGYFWISYYDQSLVAAEAFDFDKQNEDYFYVDQHDYMYTGYIYDARGVGSKMANVFSADATSELTSVSLLTTAPETEVSYEVYLLRGDYDGPEDGLKIAQGTASFPYGGYHRIDLEEGQRAILSKGQEYSVVVCEKDKGKAYFPYALGLGKDSPEAKYFGHYSKSVINKGESFYLDEGKWYDLSEPKAQELVTGKDCKLYNTDNFPIKAYLEPVQMGDHYFEGYLRVRNWSAGTPGTFVLPKSGESMLLTAEFRGSRIDDPAIDTEDIRWTSSDEKVFTVEPRESDPGQALITGTGKPGDTAYLTVDTGRYGKRVVGIQIEEEKVTPAPAAPAVTATVKIKSLKKTGSKMKVKWKCRKASGLTGYQLAWRVKGASKWKTKKLSAAEKSRTIKSLKKGKAYQVRIRAFVKAGAGVRCGKWSKTRVSGK